MVTFHAGRLALIAILASLVAACSREQLDWRSAEGANTSEAWAFFIDQHPDSELVPQARARIAQIAEERDWQHATSIATADAYRGFLAQHPSGNLAEQARIRIEAFSLGSAPRIEPQTPAEAAAAPASGGVRALELVTAAASPPPPPAVADTTAAQPMLATPGEAAQPLPPVHGPAAGESAQPLPAAADGAVPQAQALAPAEAVPVAAEIAGETAAAGYGVQLGAFGSEASADREWQRLQERFGAQLGGLSPRIVVASSNSGQFYRLQAAAAGEAQARAICDSLREQSQACVPVIPR